ncbi:hypothetical protein GWK91_12420 [Virgibacillus sp. MSP4-1]|uniref:hypothetical protein n=1 Tax=Virgibacillus sp. MSP4-1 TaxID=2700081 RepID=UPI00039F65C7|nr:hypothetical protein [Virgibacillus sp. MSP4-1]QHS23707.1 hypothetical protein GWK91_12420 [Virgibacillus sp. MSP4-1]
MKGHKKFWFKFILIPASLLIAGYLCISLLIQIKLYNVKQEVLDHNPEITSVESIDHLGGWGEFFREYVLIVKKGTDTKYRVWTFGDGEITDEVIIK